MSAPGQGAAPGLPHNYEVDLPGGGKLYLQSPNEVDLWNKAKERYVEDYHLTNTNDLLLLGAILQQQVILFRALNIVNGMTPVLDANGVPTGAYQQSRVAADEMAAAQTMMKTATSQITSMEGTLGIDKKTREAGGQVSVASYLRTLKRAAHDRGIHIVERVKKYELFVQELSWRLRVLENADAEDRAYHDLTPEKVNEWARNQILELEEYDKQFAKERGVLYLGKL